jgi:Flp pilus assembly protein TadG
MIRFFRRLWKDKRGNAILIAGAALPMLAGAAGLATDTVQWVLWKRELQRAADSAALAGVFAKAENLETVSSAVTADLGKNNNHTGVTLSSGYPQITYPADSNTPARYSNAVKVTLAIQKTLGFSSLFMSTAPTITASGTAAMVPGLSPCAIGLSTSTPSVVIGGSSTTNLGCPVMANSTACPAVTTSGSAYNFVSPTVAGVGCLPSSIIGVTSLLPHYLSQADPFAGKYSTSIPADANCGNLNQGKYTKVVNGVSQTWLHSYENGKACYSGNNGFKLTGGTYYLDPGTYYLNSTDFDTTGGTTVIGVGVTIILTGTTPGSISTNGNSTIQLSAPTTGTFAKMLFIQSSAASTNNANTINGNNLSSFDGAIYLPNGQVTFSGSTGASTKCAMVIGYTLQFTGNTNLQNNTTGCTANTTATIQIVKLIA